MNRVGARLSARERRLFAATGAVVCVAVGFLVVSGAVAHVSNLDASIDLLEEDLFFYTAEAARNYEVEQAAAWMAAQHSSGFTQEEIHDGLRREIHGLSLVDPSQAEGGTLVQIPSLPYGRLSQSGDGFREYQIEFRTAPASMGNLVVFLRRLQQSPQALFVNSLTLERAAQEEYVTPAFVVTRTIIDDVPVTWSPGSEGERVAREDEPPVSGNLVRNASFEEWDSAASAFPEWVSEGCVVERTTERGTEGAACLRLVATSSGGTVYQRQTLIAGAQYRFEMDALTTGAADVSAWDEQSGQPLLGGGALPKGDSMRRQTVTFKVPGRAGSSVAILVPYVVVREQDAEAYLDNATLVKEEE